MPLADKSCLSNCAACGDGVRPPSCRPRAPGRAGLAGSWARGLAGSRARGLAGGLREGGKRGDRGPDTETGGVGGQVQEALPQRQKHTYDLQLQQRNMCINDLRAACASKHIARSQTMWLVSRTKWLICDHWPNM